MRATLLPHPFASEPRQHLTTCLQLMISATEEVAVREWVKVPNVSGLYRNTVFWPVLRRQKDTRQAERTVLVHD